MSWYVLHVRPRTEKRVAALCQLYGLECFLPLREEVKIYQRRKVRVFKPLFPSYLFASITPDSRVYLQRTNNIIGILSPDCEATLLWELDQIRKALLVDPGLAAQSAVKEGSRVRIKCGVLAGIEGVLLANRNRTQVRLNVDMIGQSVVLDVDREFIELILDE